MTDESQLLRVLYIGGRDLDHKVITDVLQQAGYAMRTRSVATPQEMQAALREQTWDAALFDYRSPNFDASQALALLRQAGHDLPFVIVSSTIDDVKLVNALRAGAHDFITMANLVRLAPTIERERREAEARRQRRELADEIDPNQAWILATINDAVIAGDENDRLIFWNQAAERIYGWKAEEVLGRTARDVLQPDFLNSRHAETPRRDDEIREFFGDVIQSRRDGSRIHMEIHITELRNDSGRLIGRVAVNRELTLRQAHDTTIGSLLHISQTLHGSLEPEKLLEALIIEAMKLTHSELGWAGLPTAQGMTLIRHISREFKVVPFEYCWPPGIGWPGWVLAHKMPYLSNDAPADTVIVPEIRERFGVKAGLDTPILDSEGNVLGFFEVNNKSGQAPYTEHDAEKLMAVSRVAALALQNASSYQNLRLAEQALKTRVNQQAKVSQLGLLALSGASLREVFDEVAVLVAKTFAVEFCQLLELLPSPGGLKLVAGYGWKEGAIDATIVQPDTHSQAGYTLLSKQPVIVEDLLKETRFRPEEYALEHRVVSGITVLVGNSEKPYGVLGAHTIHRRTFTQDDIHFLQAVANLLATTIERHWAEDELRRGRERLQSLSRQLVEFEEQYRLTLARELHDELGQQLTRLSMELGTVAQGLPESATHVRAVLEDAAERTEAILGGLRRMITSLRPPVLDDLGLWVALRQLADDLTQEGMAVEIDFHASPGRLSARLETMLFRIVQEALANVRQHAHAARVRLRLTERPNGWLRLQVEDNGVGFDPGKTTGGAHFGLVGMRERAAMLDGQIEIISMPGKGTTICVEFPISRGHDKPRQAADL